MMALKHTLVSKIFKLQSLKLATILLIYNLCNSSLAQTTALNANQINLAYQNTTTPSVIDAEINSSNVFSTQSHKSYVLLSIDNDESPYLWYKTIIDLDIYELLSDGVTFETNPSHEISLEVEYNPNGNTANVIDKALYQIPNKRGIKILIKDIQTTFLDDNSVINTVTNNVNLKLVYEAYRTYDLDINGISQVDISPNASNNEETFIISWENADIDGAESYDLEWTWVDSYSDEPDDYLGAEAIPLTVKDFEKNSTRISTREKSYEIPNIYDSGFIVARLRAVGRFMDEPETFNYGKWSTISATTVSHWAHAKVERSHEGNKNWQFQASYAEDGKKKEVVSYFDGSLRNRQTVTKVNTDSKAIVGEVIYDNQGRPAIEVLPVPVSKTETNELKFYTNFNLNPSSIKYSHLDFDWDASTNTIGVCGINVNPMIITNGASFYYSKENDSASEFRDFIPDAEQFPFSQIEYTPDNTGRIKRKSGVGITHQLGTGHEMKYFYSKPFQKELDRLFGSNVGWDSHYKKNVVIDPNGQVSVSYIDPQGRTIATALASDRPKNGSFDLLDGLRDEDNTATASDGNGNTVLAHDFTTQDLLFPNNNSLFNTSDLPGLNIDNAWRFNAFKTVLSPSDITFDYDLTIDGVFTFDCEPLFTNGIGYPFIFDLHIDATNECGDSLTPVESGQTTSGINQTIGSYAMSGTDVVLTATPSGTPFSENFVVNSPPIGDMGIKKLLKVNEDALNLFAEDYITKAQLVDPKCMLDASDFDASAEILDCFTTCAECVESIAPGETLNDQATNYINTQLLEYTHALDPESEDYEFILGALTGRFNREFELLVEACNARCQGTGVSATEEGATDSVSCNVLVQTLINDMKLIGQYGLLFSNGDSEELSAVPTETSVFSDTNLLGSQFIIDLYEDASVNPNPETAPVVFNWRTPFNPNYPEDPYHYYDLIGNIITILIPIDSNNESPYAVIDGVVLQEDPLNPGFAIIEPHQLEDFDIEDSIYDFRYFWQDAWAASLVAFHPEYGYIHFYNELCQLTKEITVDLDLDENGIFEPTNAFVNPDGFESILQGLTFSQASAKGYLDVSYLTNNLENIVNDDPLFNNLPANLGFTDPDFHKDITLDAIRFYEGIGESMLYMSYLTIVCNSISACNGVLLDNNDIALLTPEEQESLWEIYRNTYISFRDRLKSAMANTYALNNGFYNGCIGEDNANPGDPFLRMDVIYQFPTVSTSQSGNDICGTNEANYHDKIKRIISEDYNYDSNQSLDQIGEDLEDLTDTEYYIDSGQCPMGRDFDSFIKGIIQDTNMASSSPNLGQIGSFTGLYLSMGLFVDLGGLPTYEDMDNDGDLEVVNQNTGITFDGTQGSNSNTWEISIEVNNPTTTQTMLNNPITLVLPSSFSYDWDDYNSTWVISEVNNLQYTSHNSNTTPTTFNFAMAAKITAPGSAVVIDEIIITGTTIARIGDCIIEGQDSNSDPEGEVLNEGPDTTKVCDDLNHIGVLFSMPITTSIIENTERLNLGTGLYNFVNTTIDQELYFTFYDDISNSGRDGVIQQDLVNSLTSISGSEISAYDGVEIDPIFQIQDDNYYDTLGNIFYAINNNSNLTLPMDITFVVLTADDLNRGRNVKEELEEMYELNKTKKVFFILLDTNTETVLSTPSNLTPFEYLDQLITGTPIAYNTNLGFFGSDYIFYDDSEIGNSNFPDVFEQLLQDAYDEILEGYNAGCERCIPQIPLPKSSFEMFDVYTQAMAQVPNYSIPSHYDVTHYGNMNYQYITEGYIQYLETFAGSLSNVDIDEVYFLTLPEFGATPLNYGYNDYLSAIEAYYDYSWIVSENRFLNPDDFDFILNGQDHPYLTWSEFVISYLDDNTSICPPKPMIPIIDIEIIDETPDCEEFALSISEAYGADNYAAYLERIKRKFKIAYINDALASVNETFNITYADKEYQYTLYYYDQAGNLMQTVPPQGVKRIEFSNPNFPTYNSDRENNTLTSSVQPQHELKTKYRYNSLNQLVWQWTPDGGETKFAYDELGRIIASQNEKQGTIGTEIESVLQYSYTRYDGLGRITEAGEIEFEIYTGSNGGYFITPNGELLQYGVRVNNFDNAYDQVLKREVTRTIYDEAVLVQSEGSNDVFSNELFEDYAEFNSINRVTGVLYYDEIPANSTPKFDNALLYNYDVHGNVKEMITYITELEVENCVETAGILDCEPHLKRVSYDYDLISGNVNQVTFQKHKPDQFIHAYQYDADNRITNVMTSKDGNIWENDANYKYYEHGPLARVELGDKKVQGLDYVYTLQGWLKSVNGESIAEASNDIGGDGAGSNSHMARDAFGYALHYFDDDYTSIGNINSGIFKLTENNHIDANERNLYNGNIKTMITALRDDHEVLLNSQANQYGYDQLNRITFMNSESVDDKPNQSITSEESYASSYGFDRNGNLKTLNREVPESNGLVLMDDFDYKYKSGTNQLLTVIDKADPNSYTEDLEDQITQLGVINYDENNEDSHNYVYDKIGQLIQDKTEDLNIFWRVDGKVKEIIKGNGTIIRFKYDGLGNRIGKEIIEDSETESTQTIYARDAQGNVLGVYEKIGDVDAENIIVIDTDIVLENGLVQDDQGTHIAENSISVAGGSYVYTIEEPDGALELVAGNNIVLKPGFTAEAGSNFIARIGEGPQSSISSLKLKEHHIYGSSRLGLQEDNLVLLTSVTTTPEDDEHLFENLIGDKRYELSNHLGNVLSVISDKKLADITIDKYEVITLNEFLPDVVAYNDYYPFGMTMPKRYGSVGSYRYGFNGKEKDDEIKGESNSYDFGARMYDPRVGRWFATDPLEKNYPYVSPYSYVLNNPVIAIDPDGKDVYVVIWFTKRGEVGHVGLAVDNYKVVHTKVVENGKEIIKTDYVKDGTVTFYDFGPNEDYEGGIEDFDKTIKGFVGRVVMKKSKLVNDNGFFNKDPVFDQAPNRQAKGVSEGLIQLYTDSATDLAIKNSFESKYEAKYEDVDMPDGTIGFNDPDYNSTTFENCTGFVLCEIAGIGKNFINLNPLENVNHDGGSLFVGFDEPDIQAPPMNFTAPVPNKLFVELKKILQNTRLGKILRDEGGSNKPFVDALTGDKIKDKDPKN